MLLLCWLIMMVLGMLGRLGESGFWFGFGLLDWVWWYLCILFSVNWLFMVESVVSFMVVVLVIILVLLLFWLKVGIIGVLIMDV